MRGAGVEVRVDLQLGERRAVDGEVVREAERERREVLLCRLAGCRRGKLRLSRLALFAASASVLERPRAVGALGDRSFRSSAVVSHPAIPAGNSTTMI
jgi:hypothetical protein